MSSATVTTRTDLTQPATHARTHAGMRTTQKEETLDLGEELGEENEATDRTETPRPSSGKHDLVAHLQASCNP